MPYQSGVLGIVAVCAVVLLIGALRRKSEGMLNFILRTVFGVIAIYFGNKALPFLGASGVVGLNVATVLTSGFLGIPGVAVLFGIFLVKSM